VRAGLAIVVDAGEDIRLVAPAGDGAQVLAMLAATHADVVLRDVQMPKLNGGDATAALTARGEPPKVIAPSTTRWMLDHLSRGAPRTRDDHAVGALTNREREVPQNLRTDAGDQNVLDHCEHGYDVEARRVLYVGRAFRPFPAGCRT
jgi:CheY-like chemotaxis protein